MNNAKQIVERFGGQSSLAGLLGKRQSTVQHWVKTGRIPSQWHPRLLQLAHEQGIGLDPKDFVSVDTPEIEPAGGKLGVLLVGLGAVSSTFIAGVEHIRQGTGQPIGSLSQMATIRLGKRPDKRSTADSRVRSVGRPRPTSSLALGTPFPTTPTRPRSSAAPWTATTKSSPSRRS